MARLSLPDMRYRMIVQGGRKLNQSGDETIVSRSVQTSYENIRIRLRDYEWLERCIVPAMDADNVLTLMGNIRDALFERFTFDRFGILVGTFNDRFCRIHEIVTGESMEACPTGSLMIVKSTGLERVYHDLKLHYNPDILANPEFLEDPELASIGLRSLVRVPFVKKDKVFGVMTLKSVEPHHYSPEDLSLIEKVASHLTASIYSLKLIYTLREASYKDPLTGAVNRRFLTEVMTSLDESLLEEVVGLSVEKSEQVGLLFVDLDGFKSFNDSYGHVAGDTRLSEVAKLMSQSLKGQGFVTRYGGDEFLVVIPGATDERINDIRETIESGVALFNQTFSSEPCWTMKLSVGVALGDWTAFEHLIHRADKEMYTAKKDDGEFRTYQRQAQV